jgi:hypothetical protein
MRVAATIARAASAAVLLTLASVPAFAQTSPTTPCGPAVSNGVTAGTQGLTSVDGGWIVNDANLGVCWMADANLAGSPLGRLLVGLYLSPTNIDGSTPEINPDGTMNYATALNWVNALNRFNGGKGWLNQHNWQLPATAPTDPTCSSQNGGNFGVSCTQAALANLYNVGLARTYPNSVVPLFLDFIWPFFSLQPGLYWTSDSNIGGEVTFSFNTGQQGSNTTKYNYFHVLPMTHDVLGPLPADTGVRPYTSGPAAGRAVYDSNTGLSWALNANLPLFDAFGVTGSITITSTINNSSLTVPLIDPDGAVHFSAIDPANTTSGWIVSMNASAYAGTPHWMLPAVADMQQLYADVGLHAGDTRLEWPLTVGPFQQLQPGFYWACERDDGTMLNAPCDPGVHPGTTPMAYSFDFDDGFLGTDHLDKQFYVMVYFPAP